MASNMEILCAELNYPSNVKPRITNKIFAKYFVQNIGILARLRRQLLWFVRKTSLRSNLSSGRDRADRAPNASTRAPSMSSTRHKSERRSSARPVSAKPLRQGGHTATASSDDGARFP